MVHLCHSIYDCHIRFQNTFQLVSTYGLSIELQIYKRFCLWRCKYIVFFSVMSVPIFKQIFFADVLRIKLKPFLGLVFVIVDCENPISNRLFQHKNVDSKGWPDKPTSLNQNVFCVDRSKN